MFLDVLGRRNRAFLRSAIRLHRDGEIAPNSYAIDLDAVTRNARRIREEADRHGLEVFVMAKQVGRGAPFAQAVKAGGIDRAVAVDLACAAAAKAAGLELGHIGHLVQISTAEADVAARLNPANWTVFNYEKAREASAASERRGHTQDLLARVFAPSDHFYRGHEGGFDAAEAVAVADRLDRLPSARFAGITTFPALLFDIPTRRLVATPNLSTLATVAEQLAAAGRVDVRVNAPGTTAASSLRLLADAGATQVEPGHGLTGTTPAHAFDDLPEEPAVLYLSEISHHAGGKAYCFGGGLYVDPVFGSYDIRALIAEDDDPSSWTTVAAELPPPGAIDYYGMLDQPDGRLLPVGATVVFGFRIQAFVTRATVVGISGVSAERPEIRGAWGSDGAPRRTSVAS
jgi:predicted amino acid racemase